MNETLDQAKTQPLGTGWITAAIAIGVFAALIGLDGMALSFQAVTAEMAPEFGKWAPGVPLGVDLAVFVFSGVDLLLARLDIRHPLPRAIVYAATAATIALNAAAGGTLPGRLAHVAMPLLWVGFAEVSRHVVRTQVGLAAGTLREPIPVARWVLSPWPTAKLYRRMVLWRINSYTVALTAERGRLRAIAMLREEHGRLWRLRTPALARLELSLGPTGTVPGAPVEPSAGTVAAGSSETRALVPVATAETGERFTLEPGTRSVETTATPATVPPAAPETGNRNAAATRRRVSRNTATAPPAVAKVGVLLPKDQQRKIVGDIVDALGPDVALAVITDRLDCSKATASRLRAEAVAALKNAAAPTEEPETDREAS